MFSYEDIVAEFHNTVSERNYARGISSTYGSGVECRCGETFATTAERAFHREEGCMTQEKGGKLVRRLTDSQRSNLGLYLLDR